MKKYFLLPLVILFLFSLNTFAQTLDPRAKLDETMKDLEKQGKKAEVVHVRTDKVARNRVAIEKGTSLIWYNSSVFPIDISFRKYYEPLVACDVPINFYQGEAGFYKAEKILPRDLASFCFIEPGMYFYEVSGITGFHHGAAGFTYTHNDYRDDFRGLVIVK